MSEFKDRAFHFYAQIAGGYKWPNSAEGDLLKIAMAEIEKLESKVQNQRTMMRHNEEYIEELESCLREAITLMEDVRTGEYKPDSFTTQPWRKALFEELEWCGTPALNKFLEEKNDE